MVIKKSTPMVTILPKERIESKILLIREKKVMLDRDLADLYGVTTGNLNKAVRRNLGRFPDDFMFQLTLRLYASPALQGRDSMKRSGLTQSEMESLKFQFGSLKRGTHSKYSS